ncbi:hypothetical protein GW17_00043841 [Ensete ventricosum]|nr:hypothetical protein GW17_00043841 [Ensete ventricosum]
MAIPRRTINVTQKTNPEPHGGAEPTPRKDHTQNAIENPTAVPNHRTPPTLEETHPILPDCSPILAPTSPFGVTPLGPGPRFCICKGPPVVGGDAVGPVSVLHLTVHMDQDHTNGDYADDHRNSRAEERTGEPSPFSGASDRSPVIPPAFPPGSLAHAPHRPHFPGFVPLPRGPALPLVLLHLFVLSNLLTLWSPLFGLILGDFCGRRCRCRCRSQSLRCVGLGNESSGSEGPMMTVVDGVRGGRAEVAGLRQGLNRGAIVVVVAAGY